MTCPAIPAAWRHFPPVAQPSAQSGRLPSPSVKQLILLSFSSFSDVMTFAFIQTVRCGGLLARARCCNAGAKWERTTHTCNFLPKCKRESYRRVYISSVYSIKMPNSTSADFTLDGSAEISRSASFAPVRGVMRLTGLALFSHFRAHQNWPDHCFTCHDEICAFCISQTSQVSQRIRKLIMSFPIDQIVSVPQAPDNRVPKARDTRGMYEQEETRTTDKPSDTKLRREQRAGGQGGPFRVPEGT